MRRYGFLLPGRRCRSTRATVTSGRGGATDDVSSGQGIALLSCCARMASTESEPEWGAGEGFCSSTLATFSGAAFGFGASRGPVASVACGAAFSGGRVTFEPSRAGAGREGRAACNADQCETHSRFRATAVASLPAPLRTREGNGQGQVPIGLSQFFGPQVVGYSLPPTHVMASPQLSVGSQVGAPPQVPIGLSQFFGPQVVGYSLPPTHVMASPQLSVGSQVGAPPQVPIALSQFFGPQVGGYFLPPTHVMASPQLSVGSQLDAFAERVCVRHGVRSVRDFEARRASYSRNIKLVLPIVSVSARLPLHLLALHPPQLLVAFQVPREVDVQRLNLQ